MKNSEQVYKLCIVMCRNVLFDRWMTWLYVMAIMDREPERNRVTIIVIKYVAQNKTKFLV